MAISPSTNLKLLKCPLEINNKNQLTFKNATEQFNYFNSLEYIEINDISYQRHNNIIRFPSHIDNLLQYNYVMYQNENYLNKWFYAFIINMNYVNDNRTDIQILSDSFQTWQFDINFKESFIEREMINVSDDVPGNNLLPENFELGELKIANTFNSDLFKPVPVIAYSGTKLPTSLNTSTGSFNEIDVSQAGFRVNGIESSISYILCPYPEPLTILSIIPFQAMMNRLQTQNYSEYIVDCFTVPYFSVQSFFNNTNKITEISECDVYLLQGVGRGISQYFQQPLSINVTNKPSSLDGYTPINKKMLTYPYTYLGFNPTNGSQKIYRFENFSGNINFNVISEVNPNPTICILPQNYQGENGNSMANISNFQGYPTLASKVDTFNSWLAQNGNIISLQMSQEQFNYEVGQTQAGINYIGDLATSVSRLDVGSAISSTLNTSLNMASREVNHDYYIKQQMAQIEKQKLLPDKVNMSGSNATLLGYDLFSKNIFATYTIKRQFAERIDKYFSCYGYSTNKIKLPNLNNRPNWNYIKCTGANIQGNIPQEDIEVLKNIFNNGVTLWHNPQTFLDYSQNNK